MSKFICLWSKLVKKSRFSSIVNSSIHKTSKVESGCNIVSVKMDKYSFCGYDCEIIDTEIGSFCSIANNVVIGGAMHPISWASTSPVFYKGRDSVKKKFEEFSRDNGKRTYIGHDVWIGGGVYIKQGVKVGNGAVIGMGSIVTKNVPDYAIVAGNPAKLIRMRFDDETIEKLEESQWWSLTDDQLQQHSHLIREPKEFAEAILLSNEIRLHK